MLNNDTQSGEVFFLWEAQEAQLLFLSQYLEKSMEDAGLTDSAICKARHAQKNILQKLNSVRSDLDNFISGVKPENQNNISL